MMNYDCEEFYAGESSPDSTNEKLRASMKLYVWVNPYAVPYGGSIVYVVANGLREARRLAKKAKTSAYGLDPDKKGGADVSKRKPDRILNVPCAEIYEWSE